MTPSIAAFIPARAGSKRIKDKNIRLLGGHPMLAYSIRAAIDSGAFAAVICATDSQEYADIARHYGAEVPYLRPTSNAGDTSPDIEWVVWLLEQLRADDRSFAAFSILRPTSPFRQPQTIRRALHTFLQEPTADSLRAVEKCSQHPGKMWVLRGKRMLPVLPFTNGSTPWHSSQYAALPEIYVQNASLEIAWSRVALEQGSIAGDAVIPFLTEALEGVDVNNAEDWWYAEHLIATREAVLPLIDRPTYAPPTATSGR